MQNGDIIVIDRVEDDSYDGKDYKKVTDKAGATFNVKYGQGGKLKDKWHLLEEGIAIKLTVGTYNNKPFVKDFEVVKDEFAKQAAEKVQTQVKTERNDSIERAVAVKEIGLDWREGKRKDNDILVVTREAWLIDAMNYKEAKGEATKDNMGDSKSQDKGESAGQTSGEALEVQPKTVGDFLNWLTYHKIKNPRVFLEVEYKVGDDVLTIESCQKLYKQIRKDKGW